MIGHVYLVFSKGGDFMKNTAVVKSVISGDKKEDIIKKSKELGLSVSAFISMVLSEYLNRNKTKVEE